MLYFSIENARARVHKDLAIIDDGSVQMHRSTSVLWLIRKKVL